MQNDNLTLNPYPSNPKVVVFGGSGFLGSHVADVLTEANYEVKIFDIKN